MGSGREVQNKIEAPPRFLGGAGPYRVYPGDLLEVSYFRPPAALGSTNEYLITELDRLEIQVLGHEEYRAEVKVRPDGRVSFYHVGDVMAKGLTVPELREELERKFTQTIPAAQITVFLMEGAGAATDFVKSVSGYRESDSSRSVRAVRVSPDGTIDLPTVGMITVGGLSLSETRRRIEDRYATILGWRLGVTLNILTSAATYVSIVGEVYQPGVYSVQHPVSPIYAIALAGGKKDTADLKHAVLVTVPSIGRPTARQVDMSMDPPSAELASLTMGPQDMLIIPKTGVANMNLFVDQYIRRMLPVHTGLSITYPLRVN